MKLLTPLILQRADPFVYKHTDGYYYFTASVPAYDGIELRRAKTIGGLTGASTVMVWRKPDTGPFSELIWAPEIHFRQGAWYIYFAAAPSREIKDNLFQHRMWAITTDAANPMEGTWKGPFQMDSGIDTFCLDATTFEHRGELYYLFAQKGPGITGNSNLYLAKMADPLTLATQPVMLSKPEFPWEIRGFWVNEGPAVLVRHGKVFITYSASATDENYCMGLLWADENADLLDPQSWHKAPEPIFQSCFAYQVYGPGHSSFTVSEDGSQDLLVFHARTYTEIVGDPLWDPNRHTYVKPITWQDGLPVLGRPSCIE